MKISIGPGCIFWMGLMILLMLYYGFWWGLAMSLLAPFFLMFVGTVFTLTIAVCEEVYYFWKDRRR